MVDSMSKTTNLSNNSIDITSKQSHIYFSNVYESSHIFYYISKKVHQ